MKYTRKRIVLLVFLPIVISVIVPSGIFLKNIAREIAEEEILEVANLEYLRNVNQNSEIDSGEEINSIYYETNVPALIQIEDEADIISKRNRLIAFLWGNNSIPVSKMPESIEKGFVDVRYSNQPAALYWLHRIVNVELGLNYPIMKYHSFLNNLERIDRIIVEMEWGLDSIIYHFVPIQKNNQCIIYQQGHNGDFIVDKNIINAFLSKGYAVVALCMPLLGLNSQPVVYFERFGRLKIVWHEHMKFLKPAEGHPLKYFLEPVAVILNYLKSYEYRQIHMTGYSGGGWTTTLYAAIDTRISRSYPVAGSLPVYLRSESKTDSWGDYEQTIPEFYEIANYLELYILGSYGENRKQLQILNKYDPQCFEGMKYKTYEHIIKNTLRSIGKGEFDVYLDTSHREHKFSGQALNIVFNDLESHIR